jgi:hypothetical protein
MADARIPDVERLSKACSLLPAADCYPRLSASMAMPRAFRSGIRRYRWWTLAQFAFGLCGADLPTVTLQGF